MKKFTLTFCIIFIFQAVFAGAAFGASVGGSYISSQGACVLDFETGEVIYEYNGNVGRVPASMTKVMTIYLVYEAMAQGRFNLNTKVPISNKVYSMSCNPDYQCVSPLYTNGYYTLNEILDIVIVYSATGAAVALAELVGGTEANFVKMMNNKASQMGIYAKYYDSCGIANNVISPIAMAHLARNLIKDYPEVLNKTSQKKIVFKGVTYKTTNHLLDTYFYAGADGLKTGTTSASGYCFCGTAAKIGRRIIAVTMGSSSSGQRFIDVTRLLDYGFANAPKYDIIYFTDKSVFINGNEVPTFEYKEASPLIVAEDLRNYGFDIVFNPDTLSLDISYNPTKVPTPMELNYYKNKVSQAAYSVIRPNSVSVNVVDGSSKKQMVSVYNVGGYMCISAEEFLRLSQAEFYTEGKALYGTVHGAAGDVKITVQNELIEFPDEKITVIDGRAMVPVRKPMEAMGKEVLWNQELNQAVVTDGVTTLKLSPYSDVMIKETYNYITGETLSETVKLEVAPIKVNGRVLLPIRQVAEAFGASVIWNAETKTIAVFMAA